MNTKDQPAQVSDEAQELRVLANAIENGGELSRSERRTVANALRATPDHAALVEALELCIDVMTWEHRQRDPKFKPEDATPESAIGRARTALSTLSKAPQAGEDADPAEVMDDFIRAVLADNMPRTDEPYRTVAKWVRRLKPFPSSRAEPVVHLMRIVHYAVSLINILSPRGAEVGNCIERLNWIINEARTAHADLTASPPSSEALNWAEAWHRALETIMTICGLSSALSPEESLAEFRKWYDEQAERLHDANGVADLAIKHRDFAESRGGER